MNVGRADLQDCSRPATLAFWLVMGVALSMAIMNHGASTWKSLLHVGSGNPRLQEIEKDLGPIETADRTGHDGQLYYLVARDPFGTRGTPRALAEFDPNGPRYRYRRILFPLLAGGFGTFDGRATLAGMIVWLGLAMGLTTIAITDLTFQLNIRPGAIVFAIINAGVLVSLLLLTADALALALALAGICLALRGRTAWAVAACALAALTKEVYLLVPWALASWAWSEGRRTPALSMAVLPALPILAWSAWLAVSLPSPAAPAGNLGLPLVGLFEAASVWVRQERNPLELVLAAFAVITVGTAAVTLAVGPSGALRWVIAPWVVLACLSTLKVWGKPNNAARVFAILWPLVVLLLSERLESVRAGRVVASPRLPQSPKSQVAEVSR